MMHTNKMVAVPFSAYQELVTRQQEVEAPVISKLTNLNNQIGSVLDDSTVPDDVKLQHYEQLVSRYRHLKDNRKPVELQITSNQGLPSRISEVVDTMPQTAKTNAKVLIAHMLRNPDKIVFDEHGRLMYEGKAVDGSNYVDLIADTSRKTGAKAPVGSKEFLSLLRSSNAPSLAVGNPYRQAQELAEAQLLFGPPSRNDQDDEFHDALDQVAGPSSNLNPARRVPTQRTVKTILKRAKDRDTVTNFSPRTTRSGRHIQKGDGETIRVNYWGNL